MNDFAGFLFSLKFASVVRVQNVFIPATKKTSVLPNGPIFVGTVCTSVRKEAASILLKQET